MAKKYNSQDGSLFKKKVPQMPEGYYSGDKPNPNLRAFVEQHIKERPYDPETDDYEALPFNKPLVSSKHTAIYSMHSYHQGKKPHDGIREYIQHYTKRGDLVLDLFCGSGGTALAALLEERKCIAVDISPAATFITKGYVTPISVNEFDSATSKIINAILSDELLLYGVTCPQCNGKAVIYATVFSTLYECPRCMDNVPLLEANIAAEGLGIKGCCPSCKKKGKIEKISSRGKQVGFVPVQYVVNCLSENCGLTSEVPANVISPPNVPEQNLWIPTGPIPVGLTTRQPIANGFETIESLFGSRNRAALAMLLNRINKLNVSETIRQSLKLAFTGIVIAMSRLQGYHSDPRFPNQIQRGTLYTPPNHREYNVFRWFVGKLKNLRSFYMALESMNTGLWMPLISTQSATELNMPSNSVDYIFTDPPYGGIVQYAEANWIWEKWLGFSTHWWPEEIIVNDARGLDIQTWRIRMLNAMKEAYRVLKPNRWVTLCFHGSTIEWEAIQDIMAEAGFIPDERKAALTIETKEKSQKQLTSDNTVKRDLIINFRKPKPGEIISSIAIIGNEDKTTFNEKVRQIIRDYLGANPGSTKDRVYDEVVSRMVRSGQMEAHDFNELLGQVAEEAKVESGKNGGGRWYLKETELVIADAAENAREDSAAEKLGVFIKGFLNKNPGDEGVHYSDLFEHYIYAVKDKPRRQLAEFLPDYFYKTEQGTWRLPASEEEEKAKREARLKGLGRRVKRYIAQLEQGAVIPDHERPNDATLAEWIRHCKRAGLYEQGKLLYEKGGLNPDNLPEDAMVGVEEDYQVCARMLAREVSEPKRRGRKKAEE